MLSTATVNPSTPFNHSPNYTIRHILNRHSLLPSTFSLLSKPNSYSSFFPYRPLRVRANDTAQLFDYESKLAKESIVSQHLKIAIVGFVNFGRFLAATMVCQGHTVLAYSRSNHSTTARKLGVLFFQNPDDLCEEHPEVILLYSSIISMERVILTLPLQRLKRSTLFVDLLSVEKFPKAPP
ncbi:Arogenate dehydrogenase 2 [Arachis hypogaea]|uniref:Prephenate/arogenate dehydrogenase domain-containing protein n=1 Tax=Arachis hypogaea TaxID=3818 RepID=A0A444YCJ7_ARAHY|nr:Arogenate dehydrogenase 2 [Arachis hypogaea]RYQ99636.1 hypothetical protein Ahy_B07g087599 [Arachis hypogaea]